MRRTSGLDVDLGLRSRHEGRRGFWRWCGKRQSEFLVVESARCRQFRHKNSPERDGKRFKNWLQQLLKLKCTGMVVIYSPVTDLSKENNS